MKRGDCIHFHPYLSLLFHRYLAKLFTNPSTNLELFPGFAQATHLPHCLFSSSPVSTSDNPTLHSRNTFSDTTMRQALVYLLHHSVLGTRHSSWYLRGMSKNICWIKKWVFHLYFWNWAFVLLCTTYKELSIVLCVGSILSPFNGKPTEGKDHATECSHSIIKYCFNRVVMIKWASE